MSDVINSNVYHVGLECGLMNTIEETWEVFYQNGIAAFGQYKNTISPALVHEVEDWPNRSKPKGYPEYPNERMDRGDIIIAKNNYDELYGAGIVIGEYKWDNTGLASLTGTRSNNTHYIGVYWKYNYYSRNDDEKVSLDEDKLKQGTILRNRDVSDLVEYDINAANCEININDDMKTLDRWGQAFADKAPDASAIYFHKVSKSTIETKHVSKVGPTCFKYELKDAKRKDLIFFIWGGRIQGYGVCVDEGGDSLLLGLLSDPVLPLPESIGTKFDLHYESGGAECLADLNVESPWDKPDFWHKLIEGRAKYNDFMTKEMDFKDIKTQLYDDEDGGELYFKDDEAKRIAEEIKRALKKGNHILFYGPPGTGKSELAKITCEEHRNEAWEMVTATSDWTTYDTIGGYQPQKDGSLAFEPGVVLERFREDNEFSMPVPTNEWLIIDELNRADIDKAFGPLFSLLAGDEVSLSYDAGEPDPEPVSIVPEKEIDGDEELHPSTYVMPDDWRMIATMNTRDKATLYQMSYAFMRRWSFIPVGVPDEPDIDSYLDEAWGESLEKDDFNEKVREDIENIWKSLNIKGYPIGPAIIEDILKYVKDSNEKEKALDSALGMFVLPQLEGKNDDIDIENELEIGEAKERFKRHKNELFPDDG